MDWKYTKDNPLKVVTLCSGYDSQLMAIRNLGIPYECVGWSEIDKYAIQAHDAVFPEIADRNLGDMTKIDWGGYKISTSFSTLRPAPTFPMLASRLAARKALALVHLSFGTPEMRLLRKSRSILLWRM